MGLLRAAAAAAVVALLAAGCTDPTASDTQSGDASPSPSPLPLTYTGAVLHAGDYCHFLQTVQPGNNTLPVERGCLFDMTKPADVFATDGQDYSVSEVVGEAKLGVRGPNDAKVMVVCRLQPRIEFWFWITPDGHWNISQAGDVHNPVDLVSPQIEESMRPNVKAGGGVLNDIQFRCAGGLRTTDISLALNVNGVQFAALDVPMVNGGTSLDRPETPWFVDIGARMTSAGHLEGTVASVLLYQHE